MGTACYSHQTRKQHLNDIRFGQQNLMFRMVISGIKVKNIQQQSAYVIVKVNEHLHKTTMIRYTKNPHWPQTFTFDLHIDPQSMQTQFFTLQILDDSDKVHYKIKYTIYEIASGPQHHDILFSNQSSIIFDIKVAQRLHFKINTKHIRCILEEQLGDIAYSFLLKIKSQENESQSAISPKYMNPTYSQNDDVPYKYQHIKGGSQRHVSTKKALEAKNEILWEFRTEDSPFMEFDIFADDFQITTFVFVLYANKQTKQEEYKRIGSTYISFNKFFYDNTSQIAQTDTLLIQEAQLNEQLISDGTYIGNWAGTFIIRSNQYVSQCSGVKTETGIVNQSTLLLKKAKSKNNTNKEVDWLIGLQIKVETLSQTMRDKKIKDSEKIRNEILSTLAENHNIKYQSVDDMLHSQSVQIKLWKYLLEQSSKQQTEMVKEICFTVLSELIYRDDMDLDHLSIDTQIERIHNAQLFVTLMIKVMPLCLQRVVDTSCSNKEHDFFVKFAVLSYFRVPQFKQALFPEIENILIHKFYDQAFQNEKGQQLKKELESLKLEMPDKQIVHFYYPFVIQWVNFVQSKFGFNVNWQNIQGYDEIVQLLLSNIQLKNHKFIEASCAIINNSMLLSKFIHILFNQTRLYDAIQVFNTLNIVDVWLQKVNQNYHVLPTNFDYSFFFKGIKLILNGDHAVSISKSLQILYNNFHLITTEPKKELCDFLFSTDLFFKIFMHWSPLVRNTFIHLLIYRIQHRHRSLQSGFEKIRDINKELQYAFFKDYSQKERDQLINDMIYLKYSYIIQIIRKIYQQFQLYNGGKQYVQKVIQERSLKAKLIRKKAKEKKEQLLQNDKQNEQDSTTLKNSSRKSELPEISFQSQVSKAQSAIGFAERPNNSMKSLDDGNQKVEDEQVPENSPIDSEFYQSFSSFIDLNKILQEVEQEQENEENRRRLPKKQQNRCLSPKNVTKQQDMKILTRKFPELEFETSGLKASNLKYLQIAYQEYTIAQKEYLRWINQMKCNQRNFNQFDQVKDHQVPLLVIRVPKDESNQEAPQSDD
ncbi:unnamed protein product [Paramecium pentaurelia]|uniref:C2 domain-containing protein n=1 Tax=Paramecium pentaurelia TaxID=43138 RepID=A0A8S1UY36_9CILI|nr:unnamed protein product [Paramecium pentaurelia]